MQESAGQPEMVVLERVSPGNEAVVDPPVTVVRPGPNGIQNKNGQRRNARVLEKTKAHRHGDEWASELVDPLGTPEP